MNTDGSETGKTQCSRIPVNEPAPEVPAVHYSQELGAFLAKLIHEEQQRRDLERERELARLREVQHFD